jgi:AraC family transcriptional regulator of adaptative response/methylated-DNA-[protein]-cysteine methyltransferase
MTYAELARRIGRPTAVRAVGSACGRNEISVLVPCHRAVGSDGKMRGYRWGVDLKKRLLALEGERKGK